MTHYRMQDNEPSAIVLARNPKTSSLDELRTYQGNTIFLNNGDEFQLKLFNPLRERIGVQIGFNGDLSKSMLVINPGEDVILDRFLDDQSKMLFETYTYNANNQSASNAVAENGVVEINFFKEKPVIRHTKGITRGTDITYTDYSGDFNLYSTNTVNCSATLDGFNSNYTSSLDLDFISDNEVYEEKETGRVGKGQESLQEFKTVNTVFEPFPFLTKKIQLKPTSDRETVNVSVVDYCTECGFRRRSKNHNFCPKCGGKY